MKHRDHIDLIGFLILVGCTLLWGLNYPVVKLTNTGLSPVFNSLMRSVIASICGVGYCLYIKQPLFHRDIRLFHGFMVGLLFGLEFICVYVSLIYTDAARSVIFVNLSPFVVAIGAYVVVKEKLGLWQAAGMILAFLGAYLVLQGKPRTWTPAMLKGDLIALAGAVFWGATTVYIKKYLADRVHPIHTFLYQLVFSMPIIFVFAVALEPRWIIGLTPAIVGRRLLFVGRRRLRLVPALVRADPRLPHIEAGRLHLPDACLRHCGERDIPWRADDGRADRRPLPRLRGHLRDEPQGIEKSRLKSCRIRTGRRPGLSEPDGERQVVGGDAADERNREHQAERGDEPLPVPKLLLHDGHGRRARDEKHQHHEEGEGGGRDHEPGQDAPQALFSHVVEHGERGYRVLLCDEARQEGHHLPPPEAHERTHRLKEPAHPCEHARLKPASRGCLPGTRSRRRR